MRRIVAKAIQAKSPSARNATAAARVLQSRLGPSCASDETAAVGSGTSEAAKHKLAMIRKTGLIPMRKRRNKDNATKSEVSAARVIKHLPTSSQESKRPHGRPSNVITGGRRPTIPTPSKCAFPAQRPRLTAIDLHR